MPEDASNRIYKKPSASVADKNKVHLIRALEADLSNGHWLQTNLYDLGRKMGLSHHSTEDAIQDFYVALCTKIMRRYDGIISPGFSFSVDSPERQDLMRYTTTSYRNLVTDYLRRSKTRGRELLETEISNGSWEYNDYDLDSEDSSTSKSDITMLNEETKRRLEGYITQLPQHLREIIGLAYYSKYTYKQMSAFLGIPIGTVKSRLHTAVTSLTSIVENDKGSEVLKNPQEAHRRREEKVTRRTRVIT